MSLIVTLFVPEGIVLSGDSRLTLNWKEKKSKGEDINYSINGSDSTNKIFNIKNRFALGTFGAADIKGIPIAGFINEFIEEKIDDNTEIDEIPNKLQDFFGVKHNFPRVNFYISGYKIENSISVQHVYHVDIAKKSINQVNKTNGKSFFGANWGGEIETLSRLISNVKIKRGTDWKDITASPILYNFFTLQDAIDFCEYAIHTTINTLRFQRRIKTVGGPIDTLIIRPDKGVSWISRKELK